MNTTELKEKTKLAATRSEYLMGIKQWCDGYLLKEKTAQQDSVRVDTATGTAVKALKARCAELILDDALTIVSYNLDGKETWKNKPQTP